MTPLRSDRMPPSAANVSGVAKRSIAAISADQTKTSSRFPTPDCVATTAPIRADDAGHDRARSPAASRRAAKRPRPRATAIAPSSSEGTGVRTSSGGRAMNHASAPSADAQPAELLAFTAVRETARGGGAHASGSSAAVAPPSNSPRPRRSAPSTSTSALTTSTTRPWMM